MIPNKGIPRGRQGPRWGGILPVPAGIPCPPVPLPRLVGRGLFPQRDEAELGLDSTVHLPERPGHSHRAQGQTEAADRSQEVDHWPIKSQKGDILNMYYMGKLEGGTDLTAACPRTSPLSSPWTQARSSSAATWGC